MRRPWVIGFAGTLVLLLAALIVWSQVSLLGELVVRNLMGQDWGYITDQDGRIVTILPRERAHHRNPWDKSQDLEVADGPLNGLIQLHEGGGFGNGGGRRPRPRPGTRHRVCGHSPGSLQCGQWQYRCDRHRPAAHGH